MDSRCFLMVRRLMMSFSAACSFVRPTADSPVLETMGPAAGLVPAVNLLPRHTRWPAPTTSPCPLPTLPQTWPRRGVYAPYQRSAGNRSGRSLSEEHQPLHGELLQRHTDRRPARPCPCAAAMPALPSTNNAWHWMS